MEKLTYKQIKEKVGESWALIYNPSYSQKTGKLLRGELSFWNAEREKVENFVLKDKNPEKYFTVLFFGEEVEESLLLNFF